jgi:hypothetical protein
MREEKESTDRLAHPDLPLRPLIARASLLLANSPNLTASYWVCVPQAAVLLPASSRPHLAVTPLPSTSISAISTTRDFHSQVNAHAGRTKKIPRFFFRGIFSSYNFSAFIRARPIPKFLLLEI